MDKRLRCKKCNEPLVIVPTIERSEKIGVYMVQELFCPKCGIAHAEVKEND